MNDHPNRVLQQLCFGSGNSLKLLLVAAHPDDEVIGAGAQLPRWRHAQFVHVTDGAPQNMRDAMGAGFAGRQDYASARRHELASALALAGIAPTQWRTLDFMDQAASRALLEVTGLLTELFRSLQPQVIITHPYEGGHPDHDATAFAVQAACLALRRYGDAAPVRIEMTSYFNRAGIMATGEFLPRPGNPAATLLLTDTQREFKRKLFTCFKTQQKVLAGFPILQECFRVAPEYDFTLPPHPGRLYYELFDWGMTGSEWCALARAALARMSPEIAEPAPR